MKVIDAIARILKTEGAEFLSAYPTTPLIEAAAKAEIRPVLCRQERVGVGIADGYARVTNGRKLAAFCMQYGPGAENAFPGVATAYSDSTPMLLLPLGHQRDRAQVFPLFSSARTFASVTKSVETITVGSHVADVMRRAISLMRMGRPGPVMVEIPAAELRAGDTVRVAPGNLVMVDGTILEGEGGVDESSLTGESLPVEKNHRVLLPESLPLGDMVNMALGLRAWWKAVTASSTERHLEEEPVWAAPFSS